MGRTARWVFPWVACAAWLGCGQDADLSRTRAASPGSPVRVLSAEREVDASTSSFDAGARLDAGDAVPSVVLDEPLDGARIARDAVEAHDWVASVPIRVTTAGVARVEIWVDDRFMVASLEAPSWAGAVTLSGEGVRVISARGVDAGGAELARDEATVTIVAPTDTSCHAMLDALGLDWATVGPTMGVTDPVRVQPVIHDVRFRYVSNTTPTPMVMACELAPRLAELADLVKTHGIDEVIHIGIYNYRCIGGGDPATGCSVSQHAHARAIDLHAFGLAASDVEYSTETDWVISAEACPAHGVDEADRVLHEIACSMWQDAIFQIVLTPNYNADHRNHFHVDMTTGSMFIGDGVQGVDPLVPGLGDHD